MTELEERAKLTAAARKALPDSAFAYIDPQGGRHYPIHDANHVRAALSEIGKGAKFAAEASAKVHAAAKKFGITSGGSHGLDRAAFELRKRRRGSMIAQVERRGLQMEMRTKPNGTGGTDFVFEGYAAVFDTPFDMWDKWGDPYTEVVKPGAFSQSLSRPDLDVPFLIGHDDKRLALARTRNGTMQLSQDRTGLHVQAVMDGRRSDVRDLAYAVERGDNDEMSVGFVTRAQKWSDDYETRSMLDLDVHRGDVSSVPLAANPAVSGASMTALPVESLSSAAVAERRGNPVDLGFGDASDYNPDGPTHAAMTGTHTHPHAAYGAPDGDDHGHEHQHYGDSSHQPGGQGHDHGGDAIVRINDDGVPAMEEEQGGVAALALRRRRLEILALRR